jgi:hypothetical protein
MASRCVPPWCKGGPVSRRATNLWMEYSQYPANDPAVDRLRPGYRTEQLRLACRNGPVVVPGRFYFQAAYFVPPTGTREYPLSTREYPVSTP